MVIVIRTDGTGMVEITMEEDLMSVRSSSSNWGARGNDLHLDLGILGKKCTQHVILSHG